MSLGVVLFAKWLSSTFRVRSSGPVKISGRGWFSPLGWSSGRWLVGEKREKATASRLSALFWWGNSGKFTKLGGAKKLTCKQKSKFFIIGLKKEHENLLREGCCTRALLLYCTCSWVFLFYCTGRRSGEVRLPFDGSIPVCAHSTGALSEPHVACALNMHSHCLLIPFSWLFSLFSQV